MWGMSVAVLLANIVTSNSSQISSTPEPIHKVRTADVESPGCLDDGISTSIRYCLVSLGPNSIPNSVFPE